MPLCLCIIDELCRLTVSIIIEHHFPLCYIYLIVYIENTFKLMISLKLEESAAWWSGYCQLGIRNIT